ncbi:MAG TPA: hypothetical protein VMD75_05240 [Candidatus Binataceae bacterium]|nr:hypothetical protein [Candidatus Binataceae bacterium]
MKIGALSLGVLIAVFSAQMSWAWGPADTTAESNAATKLFAYNVVLKLTESTSTSGACTSAYNVCASGNCTCYEFSGTSTATDAAGQPTATGAGTATFDLTYDSGEEVETPSDTADCAPAAGVIAITGKKDVETLYTSGSACDTLSGGSPLNGGFVVTDSNVYTGGAEGSYLGGFTGTTTFKLVLTGKAAK